MSRKISFWILLTTIWFMSFIICGDSMSELAITLPSILEITIFVILYFCLKSLHNKSECEYNE